MNCDAKKVAVALSGGVDSSVCALLLKQQGFEVVGVTAKMVNDENFDQVCQNAAKVAEKIGIEHHIIDLSVPFKANIIDYFEQSYKQGLTPNPCIICNKTIKWGELFKFAAEKIGANYMATGHYAKIIQKNNQFLLYPAKDLKKDQLYYLFELSQEQLSKTLLPLSDMTKEQVKNIAAQDDLPSKSSKESQDICFIKKPMTTKKYIQEKIDKKKGEFIHKSTGEVLGSHEGFYQYTIGQRKGIGIAYSEPLYVADINVEKNIVYLGSQDDILCDTVNLKDINWQDTGYSTPFDALVKVRYNMQAQNATITKTPDGLEIKFHNQISTPAKGQAGVIYDLKDGHLIAGGWIDKGNR